MAYTLTTEQLKRALDMTGGEPNYQVDIGHLDEAWAGPGLYVWDSEYPEEGVMPLFDVNDNGEPIPEEVSA